MRIRSAALALLLMTQAGAAPAPDKDGWIHTGDGVRTKSIAFITVRVYAIGHDMKCVPAKTKGAVIDADCDKRITWRMERDVDKDKIHNALADAYAMNGVAKDDARVRQALGAFTTELKNGTFATITYDAQKKTTTFWQQNGGTSTVAGADFMKATWSLWFGKIDQPSLGDALISKL